MENLINFLLFIFLVPIAVIAFVALVLIAISAVDIMCFAISRFHSRFVNHHSKTKEN